MLDAATASTLATPEVSWPVTRKTQPNTVLFGKLFR
jgi:hypothetical protein